MFQLSYFAVPTSTKSSVLKLKSMYPATGRLPTKLLLKKAAMRKTKHAKKNQTGTELERA